MSKRRQSTLLRASGSLSLLSVLALVAGLLAAPDSAAAAEGSAFNEMPVVPNIEGQFTSISGHGGYPLTFR